MKAMVLLVLTLFFISGCEKEREIDRVCRAVGRLSFLTSYHERELGLDERIKRKRLRREEIKIRAKKDRIFAWKAGDLAEQFEILTKTCNRNGHLVGFDLPWWVDNIEPLLPTPKFLPAMLKSLEKKERGETEKASPNSP